MFRTMRRNKQLLSEEDSIKIMNDATHGVLALDGDNGYTYAVPLSFAYADNKIYFHAALKGHKLDAIKNNDKVSFCMISQDDVVQETFTTYYKSVIAFGHIRIIESNDDPEKRKALELLADKYSPDIDSDTREKAINGQIRALVVLVIDIDHFTGKAGRELIEGKHH